MSQTHFESTNGSAALLKSREIYDVLDGDTSFVSKGLGDRIKLPYQSGPKLASILKTFGIPAEYDSRSRWMYLEELFDSCETEDDVSRIFRYFFDLERFADDFRGYDAETIRSRHEDAVLSAVSYINSILLFGGHELRTTGGKYRICEAGSTIDMSIPEIKNVDRPYVKDIAERANKDIENGDFDSAITKARTLLEEVFCFVIEAKGETPSDSGNINKLYGQVKDLYSMHADKSMDVRVNTLLSGLEKIVSSVSEMRNKNSDAHGVGQRRMKIADYHARLMVNASANMADFILSVCNHSS